MSDPAPTQQLSLWPTAVATGDAHPASRTVGGELVTPGQPSLPDRYQPTRSVDHEPRRVTAQTIVGEWLDRCRARPPRRIVGQVAKLVHEMLDEQIDPDHIRRGVASWMSRGQHPAALPSFVNAVMNGGGPDPYAVRRSTTDERVAQAVEAGRRVAALYGELPAPPRPQLGVVPWEVAG